MENIQDYIQIALAVVGLASMIAAVTPNPKDDEYLKKINSFLNFIAFNFGNAANEADKSGKVERPKTR